MLISVALMTMNISTRSAKETNFHIFAPIIIKLFLYVNTAFLHALKFKYNKNTVLLRHATNIIIIASYISNHKSPSLNILFLESNYLYIYNYKARYLLKHHAYKFNTEKNIYLKGTRRFFFALSGM